MFDYFMFTNKCILGICYKNNLFIYLRNYLKTFLTIHFINDEFKNLKTFIIVFTSRFSFIFEMFV